MYKAELLICCPQTYLSPSVLHLKLKKKKKGFNFDLLLYLLSSIQCIRKSFQPYLHNYPESYNIHHYY